MVQRRWWPILLMAVAVAACGDAPGGAPPAASAEGKAAAEEEPEDRPGAYGAAGATATEPRGSSVSATAPAAPSPPVDTPASVVPGASQEQLDLARDRTVSIRRGAALHALLGTRSGDGLLALDKEQDHGAARTPASGPAGELGRVGAETVDTEDSRLGDGLDANAATGATWQDGRLVPAKPAAQNGRRFRAALDGGEMALELATADPSVAEVSGADDKPVEKAPETGAARGAVVFSHQAGPAEQARKQQVEGRPAAFLPRKLYFENTYLGGDAAFGERVRRLDEALSGRALPHDAATGYDQGFDPPEDAGLSLTSSLDQRSLDRPGRVILQVGLAGSTRCGWRRPPLDVALVLDAPAIAEDPELPIAVAAELAAQLGPQDHLAIVVAGPSPRVLLPLSPTRGLRPLLAEALDGLGAPVATSSGALGDAMEEAGRVLERAAVDRVTLPGTQTVLVVARGVDGDRVAPARDVAHALTLQGMVTSVIESGQGNGLWWEVNAAGYGNYHHAGDGDPRQAVRTELDALSHVVARLVRVNIRLAPGVEAVRILGSRVLDEVEVDQVKTREVAADLHISRTLGVAADRGDDDDGLQTVIPYFYGGDTHVILIELWVEHPGAVADVSLRYKDMVNLDNATARSSVAVRNLPREATGEQLAVARNARGFQIGEALENASVQLGRGDLGAARGWVERARTTAVSAPAVDNRIIEDFANALEAPEVGWDEGQRNLLEESLFVAARRKVGGKVVAR